EPAVLGGEVGVAFADGAAGTLDQGLAQGAVGEAGAAAQPLARALMVARAEAGPGGRMARRPRLTPAGSQPSSAIVTPAPPAAGSDSRNPAQYGELSRNSCTARRSAPLPIPCTTRTSESPARTARSRKAASASVASRTRWPIRLISAGASAGRSTSIATRSRAGASPTRRSWPDGTSK